MCTLSFQTLEFTLLGCLFPYLFPLLFLCSSHLSFYLFFSGKMFSNFHFCGQLRIFLKLLIYYALSPWVAFMYHHIGAGGDNCLLRTLRKLMEETVGLGYLEWFFILGQE